MKRTPEQEKRAAENRLFAGLFLSDQGQAVLQILREETLEQACFRHAIDSRADQQSFGPQDETLFAAWRDGQNHLVRVILDRIECGRRGE